MKLNTSSSFKNCFFKNSVRRGLIEQILTLEYFWSRNFAAIISSLQSKDIHDRGAPSNLFELRIFGTVPFFTKALFMNIVQARQTVDGWSLFYTLVHPKNIIIRLKSLTPSGKECITFLINKINTLPKVDWVHHFILILSLDHKFIKKI